MRPETDVGLCLAAVKGGEDTPDTATSPPGSLISSDGFPPPSLESRVELEVDAPTDDPAFVGIDPLGDCAGNTFQILGVPQLMDVSGKDRRIIEVLAAPPRAHRRLLQAARLVPALLLDPEDRALATSVELYGSLSLDMIEPGVGKPTPNWPSYYVNNGSDVDFVVALRHGIPPVFVVHRLLEKCPWRLVAETRVHKFATTQYTLLGSFGEDNETAEVAIDITCITEPAHFSRFKRRQDAFRKVFSETRQLMEAQFAEQGALAFDAYIHLLKAFAAKVPSNAFTCFQATCLGLFTLQIQHFTLQPKQPIAVSLFEGFLSFCYEFYSASPTVYSHGGNYQTCAIDLSDGGQWLPRAQQCWRSELYFMAVEEDMQVAPRDRMNVAHSLDPAIVSWEAHSLLCRAFSTVSWECSFGA